MSIDEMMEKRAKEAGFISVPQFHVEDLVRVVRCKDCKRYYANGGNCDQVLSDWFCADGEAAKQDG